MAGDDPVTPAIFRLVERRICCFEQVIDAVNTLRRKTRDTKTCRHLDRLAIDPHFMVGNRFAQALGNLSRYVERCLWQQNSKFFAAITADFIVRSCIFEQQRRCLHQHRVAGVVAECVVDFLEMVDVDHDARNAFDRQAARARKFGFAALDE